MKRLLINNLGLKIASLVIAIIMYAVISYDGNASLTDLKYPFTPNFPSDVYVDPGSLPSSIMVSYRGPFAQFRLNKEGVPPFSPTFDKLANGQSTLKITKDMVPRIAGLEVTRISPSTIIVKSEPIIEHDCQISLNKTGKLATNYQVESTTFDPPSITIRGPASAMQNLDYVYNKVLDVTGLDQDLTKEVELQDLFYPMHYVDKNIKVTVTIHVTEKEGSLVIKHVPIILESANPLISFKNKPRDIAVKGAISRLKDLDIKGAYLAVTTESLDGLAPGFYNLPTELRGLPDDITATSVLPSIRVEIKPEEPVPPPVTPKNNQKNTKRKKTK